MVFRKCIMGNNHSEPVKERTNITTYSDDKGIVQYVFVKKSDKNIINWAPFADIIRSISLPLSTMTEENAMIDNEKLGEMLKEYHCVSGFDEVVRNGNELEYKYNDLRICSLKDDSLFKQQQSSFDSIKVKKFRDLDNDGFGQRDVGYVSVYGNGTRVHVSKNKLDDKKLSTENGNVTGDMVRVEQCKRSKQHTKILARNYVCKVMNNNAVRCGKFSDYEWTQVFYSE